MSRILKRLLRAERLIGRFLEAYDASEAANEQQVIAEMRVFMSEV